MKKIFYFIASAIVALGAMACQNEVDENITPENTNDVVSFTVAFDEATRIYADPKDGKANFTFEKGDKLYVQPYGNGETGGEYVFNTEDGITFSCKSADLVNELKTSGNWAMVDSRENGYIYSNLPGLEGVNFYAYADLSKNVTLTLQVALFHFTVPEGVTATLKLTNPTIEPKVFYEDPYTRVSSLEFQPGEYYASATFYNDYKGSTLSYWINGVEVKSITRDFENGKVYNLGDLDPAVAEVNGDRYTDLSKALTASEGTKVVTLLADATNVATACVINANGHNLTTGDGFLALKNYNNANGYYDVVAVTKTTDCAIPGSHNSWDTTANGVYIINGTSLRVAPNVAMDANNEFKFYLLNWDRAKGATTQNAITVNSKLTAGGHNIKVGTKGTYDLYLNGNVAFYVANQDTNNKNILSTLGASTGDLFLNFNGQNWAASNATIAAYYYGGPSEAKFVKMTDTNSDGIYECTAPADDYTHIIFVRLSEDALDWNKKWNQTPGDSKVALKGAGSLGILTAYEQVEIVY